MDWLKKNQMQWQIFAAALLTAVSLLHTDGANPYGIPGHDSGTFLYIGMLIQHGGMPYLDVFDHKGPWLYILNALAMEMGNWHMIAVFEAIAFFASIFVTFQIARLRAGFFSSLLITALCTWLLNRGMLDGGNYTEEYALPWIALAELLFLRFFQKGKIEGRGFFCIGLGLSMVIALRPNMIAVWAVGIPVMSWLLWRQNRLCRGTGWMLGGFTAGIAPLLLWMAVRGALVACWDAYIVFNLQYTRRVLGLMKQLLPENHPLQAAVVGRFSAFVHFAEVGACQVAALCLIAMGSRRRWRDGAAWASLMMLFLSLLTASMSGFLFWHYGMVLLPTLAYPLAIFCEALERMLFRNVPVCRYLLAGASLLFAGSLVFSATRSYVAWYRHPPEDSSRMHITEAASYIRSHTSPEDRILVFGSQTALYPLSDRLASSKYSYQFPMIVLDSAMHDDFIENFDKTLPKIIVTGKEIPGYEPWEEVMQSYAYEVAPEYAGTDDLMIYVLVDRGDAL
ncbi:hypothetical protein [uncultured Selenomonas sp.]|uniref:hypothetical protein n=1 Tax=uncultured Selenomonas sp. TaxID=159275 RepID=UPI0025F43B0E|nr:hypothetical protein [uncultured Selenomonas sp.]